MKNISVLGATGSIGLNTLTLLIQNKKKFKVIALTANKNYKKLAFYSRKLKAKYAVIGDKNLLNLLKKELLNSKVICLSGKKNILKIAKLKTDILVSAIVGIAGLNPTYSSLGNTSVLAIANKESIISSVNILMDKSKKNKTKIIPIDSEHNAIFQIIQEKNKNSIKDIILTASGGPFWKKNHKQFNSISVNDALKHPNWKMGKKITIDSATLINKLLEVIEASILFNLNLSSIKILIHPSSIVHGIVNFIDGSSHLIASKPDMKVSIGYALNWPDRLSTKVNNINFTNLKELKFYNPNLKKFPSLALKGQLEKNKYKSSMYIVLNAANEIAVNSFLKQKIKFSDIVYYIKKTIKQFDHIDVKSIEDVLKIDYEARKITNNIIKNKK